VRAMAYALKFISGKYQGGIFPLKPNREVVIGRSSDLDMVLVEDMVSRRHAKILFQGGRAMIQDLGSTNGTFVNGEKVQRVSLNEGDRVLIGTSIIKLVQTTDMDSRPRMPSPVTTPAGPPGVGVSPQVTLTGSRSMVGTIDEIPLPDLLQLLSTSKKSGVLAVQGIDGLGRIYLRAGQIHYSTIDDSFDLSPRKALYRMLTWTSGTFELQPPDTREFLDELAEPTEGLLMDAMRQLDEITRMRDEIPGVHESLRLPRPLNQPLRELTPEKLDLVQLVHNEGNVKKVLDKAPTTDLETYEAMVFLLNRGYIVRA